ncbi:hypothetical protein [Glutamicibacter halophytocola]|uniref:hypothetical protein n=1 Tax=Glutamicibacter halophytocola TaxID=1933880 RepID=UPI001892AE64|nr:hypothetical protein [Glutamicibacter halophytocola]
MLIEFDWPDWDDGRELQEEPQLLCTYVDGVQVQNLVYSTTGLQAELDKGQGGLLWGTIIVPSLKNGVDTTVESNIREIVEQLSKRATSLSELYQSLEMIGIVEDSPRSSIMLKHPLKPYLSVFKL